MRRSGWHRESFRHGLAARGIKTNRYYSPKKSRYFAKDVPPGFSEPQTEGEFFSSSAPLKGAGIEKVPKNPTPKEQQKQNLDNDAARADKLKDINKRKGNWFSLGPQSMLGKFRAGDQLDKAVKEKILDERDVIRAIDNVKKGNTKNAIELLSDPELDARYPLRRVALERAFTELAATQAELRQPVDPAVMRIARFGRPDLDPSAITPAQAQQLKAKGFKFGAEQLKSLEKGRTVRLSGAQTAQLETAGFDQLKEAMSALDLKEDINTVSGSESPLRQVVREKGRALAKEITGLPGQGAELAGKAAMNVYEGQMGTSRKDFVGIEGQIDGDPGAAMETPYLKGNPLITDNASIQGFTLNPFKTDIPKTSGAFSFVDEFQQ